MTRIKTLEELIKYINKLHGSALLGINGVNCYSALREPNGTKNIFSVTKGTKVVSQTISNDNSIILEHEVRGISPRKTTPKVLTHSIYLSGLRIVNVYDFFTEYLTTSRIDFMYVLSNGPSFSLLDELTIMNKPMQLAQWVYQDEKLDDQLDNLGKTIVTERVENPLTLDFD